MEDAPTPQDDRGLPSGYEILDALPVGVAVIGPGQAIRRRNAAMAGIAGDAVDVGRQAPFDCWWSGDQSRWMRAYESALWGVAKHLTARMWTGGEPWVMDSEFRPLLGYPGYVLWTLTEPAARSIPEDLSSITEYSPDAIVRWNSEMRMSYMNRAAELNSGATRDEVIGKLHHEMAGYSPRYGASLLHAFQTGTPCEDEFEYRSSSGDTIYVRTRYVPEVGDDGATESVLTISQDVTARKQVELELARLVLVNTRSAQREAAFRRLAEMISAGHELAEVCEAVSREAVTLLGASQAWVSRSDESGQGLFVGGNAAAGDSDLAAGGAGTRYDTPVVVEGQTWGVLTLIIPGEVSTDMRDAMRTLADLVATACVSARTVGELERMANTDSMTGLPNRRAFFEQLEDEIRRSRRYDDDMALSIIDLDHFKRINDQHGHGVGDDVLVEVAQHLRGVVRRGEVLARIGGEEFAWILPRVDLATAVAVLERARLAVESRHVQVVGSVTISAGVACLRPGDSEKQLMTRADDALYRAKDLGRNRVEAEDGPVSPE